MAYRWCKMLSQLQDGRYVYGENLMQIYNPPNLRTWEQLVKSVNEWKKKLSLQEKKRYGMDTCIAGESPLWRLYHMYRFDLSLDLVFDVMHIGGLNIFKSYIANLFQDINIIGCNEDVMWCCWNCTAIQFEVGKVAIQSCRKSPCM